MVWFWPALGHWFRSDDLLTVYYWDREAEQVRWGRVCEEWLRPWFGVRDLYRPLVSLSFGINYAVSPAPFGFHLLNVLLLAGTAAAVAGAAWRLCPAQPRTAALAAGALVVLHPAAVEPTAWIAARTTGLQVCWSAVAYWGFLRWRDGDGGRSLPLLATALACASKEGAVLLPLSLVVLDGLRGSRPHWRTHLPFVLLVGGYLLFRKALLGVFTTAEAGHGLAERWPVALQFASQLWLPPGASSLSLAAPALLAIVGWRALGRAGLAVAWAGLLLLPGTSHWRGGPDELAGRFVFDAVPALALAAAALLAGAPARPLARGVAGLALGAWLGALGLQSRTELQRYGADDATIRAVQQELLAATDAAGPQQPYGVLGLPGLPLLQPETWGFLALRPFADRDRPVVGLTNVLTKNPATPELFGDARLVHLLVAHGTGVGVWHAPTRRLVPVAKPDPGTVDFARDPQDPRRFLPPRRLPPTAVAQLEIRGLGDAAQVRLEYLGNLAGDYAAPPEGITARAAADAWWVTSARVLPWLVAATLGGGPGGVVLSCDGAAPPPSTVVRAHAGFEALPLPEGPLLPIDRAGLALCMVVPEPPAANWRRYLLLPTGAFCIPPTAPEGELPTGVGNQVTFATDVLGTCPVQWCCLEEGVANRSARASAFEALVLW